MIKKMNTIDLAKYIAAVLVIAVHTYTTYPLQGDFINLIVNGIARLAVPFFFCCTGFFIAEKGIRDREVVLGFIKKQMKVYIFLSLIYIPVQFIQMYFMGGLTWDGIRHYIHKAVVEGTFIHLWYFPGVMLGLWVLHKVLIRTSIMNAIAVFTPVYLLGVLGDGYWGMIKYLPDFVQGLWQAYYNVFLTTCNGIFFGVPFLLMGVFIYERREKLDEISFSVGLLISVVLLGGEAFLLRRFNIARDYNLLLATIPGTFCLFNVLINTHMKDFTIPFRKYSFMLYKYHLLFYGVVLGMIELLGYRFLENGFMRFLTVFIITQGFTAFIVWKKEEKRKMNPVTET